MTEIDYLKCKLEDTEKAFDKLHKRHIELLKQQGKLEKENEQLKKQLNKKNTMNMQLREINKELGDDLYNCRLNKNIIREKLKLWQDAHKEYNIYSIKDFEESFELDAKINKEKGI